jgi:uncharacterized membrane protein
MSLTGIIFLAAGIVTAVLAVVAASNASNQYEKLGCAVTWISHCVSVNNAIMTGMSAVAIGLVLVAAGIIFLIKSWNENRVKKQGGKII